MPLLSPFLLLASTLLQAPQATITGTVSDEATGAPLPGAEVVLPDLNRTTSAAADGRYVFTGVPAGPQHLAVRYIGYTPRLLHALVPREGALEIHVALHAAPLRLRTIEVRPPVAVRGQEAGETPFPDRSLSIAAIRNDPLLAEPDAFEALAGGAVALRPESPGGVHVYGGSADETAYALDGVPVFNPYHSAGLFTAWNPDALATVTLSSAATGAPAGLSGTIAGETRVPSERLHTQGAVSTAQGRLVVDGPLGVGGAGFLVGIRSGVPGGLGAESADASRIRGESSDALAKIEAPVLGGSLRLLAYDNENDLNAAAVAEGVAAPPDAIARRNRYEWDGTSFGGEWHHPLRKGTLRIAGWTASTGATASWLAATGPVAMTDSRHDLGLVASLERRTPGGHSEAGVRLERSVTDYRMAPDSGAGPWELYTRTPIATMFARKASALSRDLELGAGVAVARGAGATWLDPDARVQWSVGDGLRLSASWTRRHQFVQSLRSPESVIGNVFPADLFVGSGAGGVPVARSDLAVLGADLRPSAGLRLGVEVYARRLAGLALVAPRSGEPFGMSGFATGSGNVRGASLDASFATERYAIVASYGLQRLRLRADSMRYVPEYGAAHLFDAGIILFPTATTSVRVGMAGAAGRRGTSSSDAVEWESCNLRDKGCELGGSPHYDPAALGAAALPPYLRFDLGVRQHFHVRVAGRSAVVAVFGTMTNVFGHTNVLTYAGDGLTGGRSTVEMRPLSPLVVGLDWQY